MGERDEKGARVSVLPFPFVCCCETLRVKLPETSGGDLAHFLHHNSHTTQYIQVRYGELSKENKKNQKKSEESLLRNVLSVCWAFVLSPLVGGNISSAVFPKHLFCGVQPVFGSSCSSQPTTGTLGMPWTWSSYFF